MNRYLKYEPGLVSVIIPYDRDRGWLGEAVESVERQTYRQWELVHASGDGTCSENMNVGLRMAQGEYIKKLDEDDILAPNCLTDLVEAIQDVSWVYADAINFGDSKEVFRGKQTCFEEMVKQNKIHSGANLYRRECFDVVGGFNESLLTAEEYEFHLRLLQAGLSHKYLNKIVYLYRVHDGQKSKMTEHYIRIQRREAIRRIQEQFN